MEKKEIKGFFWLYVCFAILTMVGGLYSLHYRINTLGPSLIKLAGTNSTVATTEQRLQELADLQLKDSDNDTLSDFDEIYTYKTSAYLQDSDSDGVTDPDELKANTNPSCPEGNDCTITTDTADDTTEISTTTSNTSSTETVPDLSPTELRVQLINLGMTEDQLNQISDEELAQAYGDIVAETTGSAQTVADLQQFDASQIRALLEQSGMSSEQLEGIDDATLEQLYQATLNE